jgi:hypothetical protein
MKYPRLALFLTCLALAAIAVIITVGARSSGSHAGHEGAGPTQVSTDDSLLATSGLTATEHKHQAEESGTQASAAAAVRSDSVAAANSSAADSAVTGQNAPAGGAAPTASGDVADVATNPGNVRQVGLAEAAGQPTGRAAEPLMQVTSRGSALAGVDADAAGVNDGGKTQAADVPLEVAPTVAPQDVLPSIGQASGCVTGYGRGAVCLPQTPPSHAGHGQLGGEDLSVYWTCAEVRSLLPEGIVVDSPSSDRLGLDSNADGTACGNGDG